MQKYIFIIFLGFLLSQDILGEWMPFDQKCSDLLNEDIDSDYIIFNPNLTYEYDGPLKLYWDIILNLEGQGYILKLARNKSLTDIFKEYNLFFVTKDKILLEGNFIDNFNQSEKIIKVYNRCILNEKDKKTVKNN